MSMLAVFEKAHWQYFRHVSGLDQLSPTAIFAADDFFDFVSERGLAAPTEQDLMVWGRLRKDHDPHDSLTALRDAMNVLVPALCDLIETARTASLAATECQSKDDAAERKQQGVAFEPWDPIAPSPRKTPERTVSIDPRMLPEAFQTTLRRMAQGLPSHGVRAPARDIVKRMREKLCQFAFSAERADLPVDLTLDAIDRYERDVTERSRNGPNGMRWATVRASIEELHRFTRYIGAPSDIMAELGKRRNILEAREKGQRSLKLFQLARTGQTTDSVLDQAEHLLSAAPAEPDPRRRHNMRNGAAVLGIFANVPLRNASANLVLGETLFWRNNEWSIRTTIQKTHLSRPEPLVAPLHADYGKFIDAVLLGDMPEELLPEIRSRAIKQRRQLFVLYNGKRTGPSYVPMMFKTLTGNSFTSTRAMIHTDGARHFGAEGLERAKIACHQTSDAVVRQHYYQEAVAEVFASNLRNKRRARRAGILRAQEVGETE